MKDSLTFDQFKRALQKIGVVIGAAADLEKIFAHYDQSADGRLNYRELAAALQETCAADDDTVSQASAAVSVAYSTQS